MGPVQANPPETIQYFDYPGFDLKFFRCEVYRASLSTKACADRWNEAQDARGYKAQRYERCRTCTIGSFHAGRGAAIYSSYFEAPFCPRCGAYADRMIGNKLCVSCYNRQREWMIGRNAKGRAPIKMRPLHRRSVRVSVSSNGAKPIIKDVSVEHSADLTEVMVNVLRTTKGSVAFGFRGSSPARRQGCLF